MIYVQRMRYTGVNFKCTLVIVSSRVYTSPQRGVVVGRMEGQGERMTCSRGLALAPFGAWRLEERKITYGTATTASTIIVQRSQNYPSYFNFYETNP